jgi:hypothetical protein
MDQNLNSNDEISLDEVVLWKSWNIAKRAKFVFTCIDQEIEIEQKFFDSYEFVFWFNSYRLFRSNPSVFTLGLLSFGFILYFTFVDFMNFLRGL